MKRGSVLLLVFAVLVALVGCGGGGGSSAPAPASAYTPTQAQPGTPVGGASAACAGIAHFSYASTTITSATLVAAGWVPSTQPQLGGMPEHCVVEGYMNNRVSHVDGQTYQIGFEMRLPTSWSGRYFYQGNGGTDGSVVLATGPSNGGGPATSALSQGFAVISSDAGHQPVAGSPIGGALFGIDPQARLDYGYNAVGTLTPMAKAVIAAYYGRGPDKSYIGGCSNGGRHTMVAASRFGDQYDGFMVGSPGFNLPKAASANLWGAQQFATISTSTPSTAPLPDITTSFATADRNYVSAQIVAACDLLDGVADNMVTDWPACQATFNFEQNVAVCPTGTAIGSGTCLTFAQKAVLADVFAGAKNSAGQLLYNVPWFWDTGISAAAWPTWKFTRSTGTSFDPVAEGFIFTVPPQNPAVVNTAATVLAYALDWAGTGWSADEDYPKNFTTNSTYTQSAMQFMTPPDLTMAKMVNNHGKMIITQGVSDPIFSFADTINWYNTSFAPAWGSNAGNYVRVFPVPGMSHCNGGPACDQFDSLTALVNWVEQGIAPATLTATARGATTTLNGANITNNDLAGLGWSTNRTRPLCVYPLVAKYNGSGSIESASSFSCVAP